MGREGAKLREALKTGLRHVAARITAGGISVLIRFLTAPQALYAVALPQGVQRVYFANHCSNADAVLIWAVLPPEVRTRTRPVAAADYWLKNRIREFMGRDVFKVLLIERLRENRTENPVERMMGAVDEGSSLIIFPEGRRNESDELLLEMRPGIYHLGQARPKVELVPVWIHNLNAVLPRGSLIPVPLLCTVSFGEPMRPGADETKEDFMARARAALLALAPKEAA
ncbi:1-acyl-sn-glycerol-3-phosphate acyltransferase [Rhodobacter sp. JA431]|uniref:lysophospholipid acyltransferase family protein n=1 Tax=Rhodobacter sp. JA431 TaxID=570013 RepID=UPI000BDD9CD7|nr:lysophospholipid acyltransferase family protein [Rhodobacter sp. JA431]SOC08657.1 1-acyl-sn-glycerol-3-phosphate acyltransferase [Rhodobacter sp. JA431]